MKEYTRSAHQYSSAVLFLLPFARFYGVQAEPVALEVRMRREAEGRPRNPQGRVVFCCGAAPGS